MRDKFYFFSSFLGTARELKDPQLQAKYLMAIAEYGLEGKESDDSIIRALMNQTKFTLDRSEEISASASERGKLWGRPRKSFTTTQKAKKANESYQKLTKANESEEEVEVEEEVENKIKEKNKKEKVEDAFASLTVGTYFEALSSEVQKAYLNFLKNREAMKIKNTPEATKQHLNLLKKIGNSQLQLVTLEKAIGANWRGLFELNESEKKIVLAKTSPSKRTQEPDFSWVDQDILWKT